MKANVQEFRLKLYPKDFYKVRNFYEKELGFKVTNEWDRGELHKGVMFNVGTTTLELLSPEDGYQPVVGASASWEVPNVHELWKHWEGKPNVFHPLRDNAWGDTSFGISDPEGFKISFFTPHNVSD